MYALSKVYQHRNNLAIRQRGPFLAMLHLLLYMAWIILPLFVQIMRQNGHWLWEATKVEDVPTSRKVIRFILGYIRILISFVIGFR